MSLSDGYGITPLMEAAVGGHVDVLGKLLEAGAQAGVANAFGLTALTLGARYGRVEVVKALLDWARQHGDTVSAWAFSSSWLGGPCA
jgi:ankyrin repeat protein